MDNICDDYIKLKENLNLMLDKLIEENTSLKIQLEIAETKLAWYKASLQMKNPMIFEPWEDEED